LVKRFEGKGNGFGGFTMGESGTDFVRFWFPPVTPCDPLFPEALNLSAVADFDGDGDDDFATIAEDANGTGTGIYTNAGRIYGADCPLDGIAAADVNGDGKIDLLAANGSRGLLHVLTGNGDGTFNGMRDPDGLGTRLQEADGIAVGPKPAHVVVADLNRDGRPDVVVVNRGAAQLTILFGDGKPAHPRRGQPIGTFSTSETRALDADATALRVVDVDNDGRLDLAVLHGPERKVCLMLANGTRHTVTVPGTGDLEGLTFADFNSDRILDFAVGGDAIRVYLGEGTLSGE
jgi:hypothetical protein